MITVVSWNIGWMYRPLEELLEMNGDVALLQEVHPGGYEWLKTAKDDVEVSPQNPWEPWPYDHFNRWPLVVKLSDRVKVEWFKQVLPSIPKVADDEIAVSNDGILAAARITPLEGGEPFIAASMYARWFGPHPTIGGWIYSDAAAHHVISDLTTFIPHYDAESPTHRILAAGDLNVSFCSSDAFDARAQTILDRMKALGLEYMGPQYPNGRRADPVPSHLMEDSLDVPTYHTLRNSPATAHVQIDHVFASRGFHNSVRTRALNGVDEWGPSDHCRILIEVGR